MEQGKNKEWISSLRGAAILLVFCSHLASTEGATFKFVIGRIGVVIFFLFSGYLAIESRNKRNRKQYIFNRFIRMYPVYWLILTLTVIVQNSLRASNLIDLKTFLANMTLFHQFIGFEEIIRASWMMPIQVSFFALIGIAGTSVFTREYHIGEIRIDMKTVSILIAMICATLVGLLRYLTRMPFPTAFFLLIAVAFIGMDLYEETGGGTVLRIIIFETGLFVAVFLSYSTEIIPYEIAYNVGILFFLWAKQKKWKCNVLSNLSHLGFPFFLCAEIPMYIVNSYVDFSISPLMRILSWIVKFVLAIILSAVITTYIEKPLNKFGKRIEKKLS